MLIHLCNSQSHVCVPGWPGAHHSTDCEGLEWPGGRDASHPSDTEEEVLVQLVNTNVTYRGKCIKYLLMSQIKCIDIILNIFFMLNRVVLYLKPQPSFVLVC